MMETKKSGIVVDFFRSVRDTIKNFADYDSCATREEFFSYVIFVGLLLTLMSIGTNLFGDTVDNGGQTVHYFALSGVLGGILALIGLALLVVLLAVTVRRLHDSGRSGYWFFITFIPLVGSFILLVFMFLPTNPDSEYSDTYFDENQ
jgi:uncharacterized membrane protein YhaH (DUF805 family)